MHGGKRILRILGVEDEAKVARALREGKSSVCGGTQRIRKWGYFTATEEPVTLPKQTKIGLCEQFRVKLATCRPGGVTASIGL